jgi:hypothetical protein
MKSFFLQEVCMCSLLVRISVIIALFSMSSLWALPKTKGTPLGGFGTGYVKFDATTGDFAVGAKVMPPASLQASEFSNYKSSSCGFHFYVAGQPLTTKAKTPNEDAKCPVYYATFDPVGGVQFKLTACGPWISGEAELYDKLAHSPLAFFDMAATNSGTAAIDAGVALEFANGTLLGGAATGAADGTNGLTFAGDENAYFMSGSDVATATTSAGALGDFGTTGTLTTGAGNVVAAKCNIPAGGTVHFRFVMAWWQKWENATKGAENHWYHNLYANSKEAAVFGMANFGIVLAGATSIVDRTMASNFPTWYKDRLLNNLYPMVHNSVVAKDGRTGFWEGRYPIIGTIDQGEHAAVWYCFNWPQNQWRELQFWSRSAYTTGDFKGQIHHDFNGTTSGNWSYSASDANHFMYPWDNSTHQDYWYQPDTKDWSDLNCMFIFKAYELMLGSANKDSLSKYWPQLKQTAQRLIVQCGTSKLPTKSKSTYDDGSVTAVYASGTLLTAWLAMVEMAKFMGDNESVTKYTDWYTQGRASFTSTYFNSDFGTGTDKSEGDVAGYSWARYFGFPAIMDSNVITTGCNRLWTYFKAKSGDRAKLGQWHFYTYDHWGGAATAIGQQDTAMAVHQWDYNFYYTASPGYVFWQDLNASNSTYASYMTGPCVWRSYFQMTGYLLDNANNRLFLRPMVPTVMGKKITNAPLINPKGWGTLVEYDENPVAGKIQNITLKFDSLVTVKEIVLKNNATVAEPGVSIKNNGAAVASTSKAEGSGYEKIIRVTMTEPIQIGPSGISIGVYDGPVAVKDSRFASSNKIHYALSLVSGASLAAGLPIRYSVDAAGPVSMELLGVNGTKIGSLMTDNVAAGQHSFTWNGKLLNGSKVHLGTSVLRLRSSAGETSRIVFIGK